MIDDSNLHPFNANDWPANLQHILEDLQRNPINMHGMSANSPELMNACWPLRNYLMKGNSLGQRRNELSILRTAAHKISWYFWGDHVDRAMRLGIEIDEILGLLKPITAREWSEQDRALIMAVDDLIKEDRIRPVTLAILNKNYSNQQVIDLISSVGFVTMISSMLQSWSVALDEDIEARVTPILDQISFRKQAEENL